MLLVDELDGTPFGKGDSKEACIEAAITNGFHGVSQKDGSTKWVKCTSDWLEHNILMGVLTFETSETGDSR